MINLFVSVFLLLRKYKCILKFKVINVFGWLVLISCRYYWNDGVLYWSFMREAPIWFLMCSDIIIPVLSIKKKKITILVFLNIQLYFAKHWWHRKKYDFFFHLVTRYFYCQKLRKPVHFYEIFIFEVSWMSSFKIAVNENTIIWLNKPFSACIAQAND